jgi:hypothetical protein
MTLPLDAPLPLPVGDLTLEGCTRNLVRLVYERQR